MKLKFLCLLFLGLTIANAQTKKTTKSKSPVKTKVAGTSSVAEAKPTLSLLPVVNSNEGIFAEVETNKGKILIQLEYKKTPVTVANFISLAEGTNPQVAEKYKGKKFYNGLKFHRVIKDFMIQGGDPDGNGSGGPGYAFKDEITDLKHHKGGILSMANSGPKTNGSQFFITHKETPWLDGKHTVFGIVVTGMEVVNAIEQNDEINAITITRKGAEAKKFDAVKVFADYFTNKAIEEQKEAAAKAAANALALKEFEKATTTATGLKYVVLKEGSGAKPVATSNVKVHYTGSLLDGKVFDSSVQRGQPIDFGLNQVIPGWTEGVQLMTEGSKYKFLIPSKLAYGERGAGGVIPPNADLIFEVELIKINQQ
ncbi:peptidylprolyl isomerase [Flavobacterium sp.]|uniref:peptidylprolyl isomerase n=1 Tax=Flavobacterium sp. TaxID=239 RepID=UPI002635AA09|nr:peptidylprolyl isomerase [Flavobacterium sp.]